MRNPKKEKKVKLKETVEKWLPVAKGRRKKPGIDRSVQTFTKA